MIEVQVSGLAELREALLRDLPKQSLQAQAVLIAMRKAAKPIIKDARRLAPVDTGRMRASIYAFRDKRAKKGRPALLVSVRAGRKEQKLGRDAYYWKWVEFGHAITHKRIFGGARRRAEARQGLAFQRARPFMRPAFEKNKREAVSIFAKEMWASIDKVAARVAARSRSARLGVPRF